MNMGEPKSNTTMIVAVVAIIIIIGAIVFSMKSTPKDTTENPVPVEDSSVSVDTETDTNMAASALDALNASGLDSDIQ